MKIVLRNDQMVGFNSSFGYYRLLNDCIRLYNSKEELYGDMTTALTRNTSNPGNKPIAIRGKLSFTIFRKKKKSNNNNIWANLHKLPPQVQPGA